MPPKVRVGSVGAAGPTPSVAPTRPDAAGAEFAPRPMPRPGAPGEPYPSEPTPAPPADRPLTASTTDDNLEFDAFLEFLESWKDKARVKRHAKPLDVSDRRFVVVKNVDGDAIPGAAVRFVDERADAVLWEARTYGDGRAPLYPKIAGMLAAPEDGLLLEVLHKGVRHRQRWLGAGERIDVVLDTPRPTREAVELDVLFVLDTTGSMADEIARIKETLLQVTARLREVGGAFDLRYGAVLYRDIGDEYLTRMHPFTGDVAAFDAALRDVDAGGGGDGPESLNQGMYEAVHSAAWREGAAKVAFLIADAPPHMDYEGDVAYTDSAIAAVGRGIRVHSVAASGLGDGGSYVFRQIAQLTRGLFLFIEYGSREASAEDHGVAAPGPSNNLDAIVYDRIKWELDHWGVDAEDALETMALAPTR